MAAPPGCALTSGEVLPAEVVVSNADAGHTYGRLLRNLPSAAGPTEGWSARAGRWACSSGISAPRARATMWPDVGHHTIVVGPRYQDHIRDIFMRGKLAEDMSLYVHRPTVTDPSVAPAGDDTFYALSPGAASGPQRRRLGDRGRALPRPGGRSAGRAADAGLPRPDQPTSLVFTPETFRDRYLSPYGAGFSIEPRILQSAWFRPHNVSEEAAGPLSGAARAPIRARACRA